ncbi:MAG: DUF507 family protein [Candidatus Sumerlaeia bacterium]|nr:DUF507 family protein [Candidatus Sumerlaeia bacterium]
MFREDLIEPLAQAVVDALASDPAVQVANTEQVRAVVRAVLRKNIAEEMAIEAEAERALRQHGAEILREGADFQRMLADAKAVIAKRKGFAL